MIFILNYISTKNAFPSPWNPHINNFLLVVKASLIANQVMKACLGIEKETKPMPTNPQHFP